MSKLTELAIEYENRCEQYDSTVCSMKSQKGSAMPFNGEELALVCKNARKVMSEIAKREHISFETLRVAVFGLNK